MVRTGRQLLRLRERSEAECGYAYSISRLTYHNHDSHITTRLPQDIFATVHTHMVYDDTYYQYTYG